MAEQRNSGPGARHIRDVMTPNPRTVSDRDSVRDVARIMRDQDTGVVPVCDDSRKIIGLVTDRDIVVRLIADGKDPMNARVNEVMTKSVRKVLDLPVTSYPGHSNHIEAIDVTTPAPTIQPGVGDAPNLAAFPPRHRFETQ